jgi:hypothetical protein
MVNVLRSLLHSFAASAADAWASRGWLAVGAAQAAALERVCVELTATAETFVAEMNEYVATANR